MRVLQLAGFVADENAAVVRSIVTATLIKRDDENKYRIFAMIVTFRFDGHSTFTYVARRKDFWH